MLNYEEDSGPARPASAKISGLVTGLLICPSCQELDLKYARLGAVASIELRSGVRRKLVVGRKVEGPSDHNPRPAVESARRSCGRSPREVRPNSSLVTRPVLDLAESYNMSNLLGMTGRDLLGVLQSIGQSVTKKDPPRLELFGVGVTLLHGLQRLT